MRLIDAEEVIKAIDRHTFDTFDGLCLDADITVILEEVPTAQQWIPCTETLPDNEKRVLCTVQSGEHFSVVPCIFIQHTRRWLPEVYGNHDNVIAWMPLPEPWKEEQDD